MLRLKAIAVFLGPIESGCYSPKSPLSWAYQMEAVVYCRTCEFILYDLE